MFCVAGLFFHVGFYRGEQDVLKFKFQTFRGKIPDFFPVLTKMSQSRPVSKINILSLSMKNFEFSVFNFFWHFFPEKINLHTNAGSRNFRFLDFAHFRFFFSKF